MEFHLAADLLDQLGGDVEGLRLSLGQDGQQELAVHILGLALGTTTVRLAALAATLDERTGKHFAQGGNAANPATTGFEFGVTRHICHS